MPQDKLLALRELCRNRYYLIDMASDLKRKITALLDQVFPEFEFQFSTIFGRSALAVLKQCPTAEKLARAQLGKLTQLLQTASNGRFGEWKAQQLQSLLDGAAALERRMADIFSQFDTPLTSIPGIGPLLGAVILSEIRDISSFSSADKLVSYAGLKPRVKQSGETKFGGIHMSKRGSPYLRRAIWMACANAVQCDPMFRAYYEKKSAEGMKYMCIIGHVTKKMTAVIFAVLRDNKVYQPILSVA